VPNPDATISRGRRPGSRGVVWATALLGGTALLGACGSSGSSGTAAEGTTSTVATSSQTVAVAHGGTASSSTSSAPSSTAPSAGPNGVNIVDYAFSPKTLTVAAGTTVTWKNLDQFAHEVRSADGDPGTAFDLGQQTTGATVSHTFATPGTYHYYCNIHNYMTGTIVVTP
jgi:plastocyanin